MLVGNINYYFSAWDLLDIRRALLVNLKIISSNPTYLFLIYYNNGYNFTTNMEPNIYLLDSSLHAI